MKKSFNKSRSGEKGRGDRYFTIRDSLVRAIDENQISIVLQPIWDETQGKIVSFESLARWFHPQLGAIGPNEFIPLSEELNLVYKLGLSLFRQSCQFLARFDRTSDERPSVNVNVSALQLIESEFLTDICKIAEQEGVETYRVTIEITESHFFDSDESGVRLIREIRQRGFRISLDDFGSGYSSMINVFKLPLQQIKTDKTLIDHTNEIAACRTLIEFLIHHCLENNIELVAEGVETPELKVMLAEMGVSLFQGYGLFMPEEANVWLQDKN